MKTKLKIALGRIPTKAYYAAVGLLVIPAYILGWQTLTSQITWYIAISNQLTVNLIIMFFLVGYWIEKYTKHMPKRKGWLIWAVAVITLILLLKYAGGIETWW